MTGSQAEIHQLWGASKSMGTYRRETKGIWGPLTSHSRRGKANFILNEKYMGGDHISWPGCQSQFVGTVLQQYHGNTLERQAVQLESHWITVGRTCHVAVTPLTFCAVCTCTHHFKTPGLTCYICKM